MNYELAKQLKDAGFPQLYNRDHYAWHLVQDKWYMDWCLEDTSYNTKEVCVNPTLSELIEACGDRFGNLILRKYGKWEVCSSELNQWAIIRDGSTPEEAVANLWLKLQVGSTEKDDEKGTEIDLVNVVEAIKEL